MDSLQYLSSEQALADLANFIVSMNSKYSFDNNTKWIAFGGSYPGLRQIQISITDRRIVNFKMNLQGRWRLGCVRNIRHWCTEPSVRVDHCWQRQISSVNFNSNSNWHIHSPALRRISNCRILRCRSQFIGHFLRGLCDGS